jgi:hypothetical protein
MPQSIRESDEVPKFERRCPPYEEIEALVALQQAEMTDEPTEELEKVEDAIDKLETMGKEKLEKAEALVPPFTPLDDYYELLEGTVYGIRAEGRRNMGVHCRCRKLGV